MQLNLNIHFWVGFLVTITSAIAGGTVHLTNAIPADWIPVVTAWSSIVATFGGAYLTIASQTGLSSANDNASASAPKKAAIALLALGLATALLSPGVAHAQQKGLPRLTGNPAKDFAPTATQAIADPIAAALLKPFQDVANFIAGDNAGAIALSTAVPELQDGHGQQCWMAAKTFSDVIKAHPIPLTLKLQTDIEAFRLLGMATNQLCANVHCTQVFADLESTAQAAGPINIGAPLPTLHDLCSKVPQIAVVAPVTVPAAPAPAPTPAPAQ